MLPSNKLQDSTVNFFDALTSGNFLPTWKDDVLPGKENSFYEQHGAFTMETQIFPNAVNIPEFGLKSVWNPGELYYHHVTYKFGLMVDN